jgi:hypothetical protein
VKSATFRKSVILVGHLSDMATVVSLVSPHGTLQVSAWLLLQHCDLFSNNPELTASAYTLKSPVSPATFQEFVSALQGNPVKITNDTFGDLSQLCEEFGFRDFAAQLSRFRTSDDFKEQATTVDSAARLRLHILEERMQQREREIARLHSELSRHSRALELATDALLGRMGRLEAEVSALRSVSGSAAMPGLTLARPFGSVIVSEFPDIFAEFREKQFSLLWRGGRDGFGVRAFHSRCDEHANTLTVILDTDGNIFGGFTPVKWESRRWNGKTGRENNARTADPSLKSFLFTLKNPHNVPARRFALKTENGDIAIFCGSGWGPRFGDIHVHDNANANRDNYTKYFGTRYANDTGLDGKTFFTGSEHYQVKEIEMFEITA